jgi:hypothetical protein
MRLPDGRGYDVLPDVNSYADLRGGYWRAPDGTWICGVPAPHFGIGSLINHDVTEHEDGTITVSPSILVETGDGRRWHGYLRKGVWEALDDCVLEMPSS